MKHKLTDQQHQMVTDNMSLVNWYMNKVPKILYKRDPDAFKQELYIGLIEAVATYDKEKGTFANHAVWRLRAAVSLWMRSWKRHSKTVLNNVAGTILEDHREPDREVVLLRKVLDDLPDDLKKEVPKCRNLFREKFKVTVSRRQRIIVSTVAKSKLRDRLIKAGC